MPTGYTAKLMERGETFEEFATRCARAFGALIMMRDDSLDAPIPEQFEPSDYYQKRIDEQLAELKRLRSMTNGERIKYGTETKAAKIESFRGYIEKNRREDARLAEMETRVRLWNPPSPDHQGLKDFMLQQIDTSKHGVGYYEKELSEIGATPPYEFYAQAVETTERGIEYSRQHDAEERERTANRNQWVKLLREGLKG